VTSYRFYVLNRQDHITAARIAECADADDIQRTARLFLDEHQLAAGIEAWERGKLICRIKRPAAALRSLVTR
jgi:hypothetical protein